MGEERPDLVIGADVIYATREQVRSDWVTGTALAAHPRHAPMTLMAACWRVRLPLPVLAAHPRRVVGSLLA